MKNTINLLYKKTNYKRIERMFFLFRRATLGLSIIICSVLIILFLLVARQNSQYNALLATKQRLIEELIPKRSIETKLLYVIHKTNFIKKVQGQDHRYAQYYHILESVLPSSTASASIKTLNVDDTGALSASVSFQNKADAYLFLDAIEKPDFADNFKVLTVNPVAINDTVFTQQGGITISIEGGLKDL